MIGREHCLGLECHRQAPSIRFARGAWCVLAHDSALVLRSSEALMAALPSASTAAARDGSTTGIRISLWRVKLGFHGASY